ncbi:putative rRNA methylase YtqB [Sporosarcina sp. NCCP-2716]|uniref:tRNA (mnm(5)s(2)U34)-methyltransferase n=1 Tax=Sporosarcina sp. NCCP-2716 TaxID=2943679 RepID=UPI00203E2124|nr:class I SAM-dependent methyltransferase [Sporosarcina sp. NCCP-2716]GKV69522.1 putative rRNA methylase YtqB [Sporosarcina sp. NCCP-2716]
MKTPKFQLQRILPFAKQVLSSLLEEGDTAVDATMGNGHDTEFLAKAVGRTGLVYAFDIQQAALEATRNRLGPLVSRTELILGSHANMAERVPAGVTAVMFNLGFLPSAEEAFVITTGETTIPAIRAALSLLKPGGIISIAVYDGHPGGAAERDAVLGFVQQLDAKDYQVIRYGTMNSLSSPPFLLLIEKSSW